MSYHKETSCTVNVNSFYFMFSFCTLISTVTNWEYTNKGLYGNEASPLFDTKVVFLFFHICLSVRKFTVALLQCRRQPSIVWKWLTDLQWWSQTNIFHLNKFRCCFSLFKYLMGFEKTDFEKTEGRTSIK